MSDCIFCKIIDKKLPAKILYEDEFCVIFPDINPRAKHHWLAIPKKHISTMLDLEKKDENLIGHMAGKLKELALSEKIDGYKLQINTGVSGGQEVMHIHMHFLAN